MSLQWGRNFIVAEIRYAPQRRSRSSSGFNGAATLSLRKSYMMFVMITNRLGLQWGRNFIVAEINELRLAKPSTYSLQWGRNFIVAEMYSATSPVIIEFRLLQWGRNFIVAEMYVKAAMANPNQTLQWGRNFIVAEIRLGGRHKKSDGLLQWGRNFIVAEIGLSWMGFLCSSVASMGPQLYRCGNYRRTRRGVATSSELQWGRNFIVAEMPRRWSRRPCRRRRFNGAATLSLRK